MSTIEKVVLAYSGGLDTSVILKWIQKTYHCEVIAMTADLGQEEELAGLEDKARSTGASKAYILDVQEEFARDFVFPALRANAVYEGRYLLGTSLARPLITKHMVDVARREEAQALAHGATGKGNDQVRFELAAMGLAPELKTIAPWREWDLRSRTDLIQFAKENGISVPVTQDKPYSCDRNLLHLSFEGGELEDPWQEPGSGTYALSVPPEQAPDDPQIIEIDFQEGNPVAIDGKEYTPAELIKALNRIAGAHGIGRVDMVENRFVGMKSRGIYETPGGTVLHLAHRDLEGICMDREAMHLRDSMIPRYAQMVYNGFWYSPEREALQAMIDSTQATVTGTVRMKLYKGQIYPLGRRSQHSLYNAAMATFEQDDVYNQADAAGFIRLQGLRLQARQSRAE
jgi:argininosuccinate synthase